jgi:hypothetical protein
MDINIGLLGLAIVGGSVLVILIGCIAMAGKHWESPQYRERIQ